MLSVYTRNIHAGIRIWPGVSDVILGILLKVCMHRSEEILPSVVKKITEWKSGSGKGRNLNRLAMSIWHNNYLPPGYSRSSRIYGNPNAAGGPTRFRKDSNQVMATNTTTVRIYGIIFKRLEGMMVPMACRRN